MENTERDQIRQMFMEKCQLLGISQNQAAIMAGTKGATISQVFNGKYAADDTAIYKLIGTWAGFYRNDWKMVETSNFKFITSIIDDSRMNQNVYALIGDAGSGKSSTAHHLSHQTRQVIHVKCAEFWSRKQFLREVLTEMGKEASGLNISDMIIAIVDALKDTNSTLILDEADKLADSVFIFFITLYNQLEDKAGLMMMGTPHLMKRITRGVELNRKGYNEIWSRLGRKFVMIPKPNKSDIASIAYQNGIENQQQIGEIIDGSAADFRRTKRLVHKYKLINANTLNI